MLRRGDAPLTPPVPVASTCVPTSRHSSDSERVGLGELAAAGAQTVRPAGELGDLRLGQLSGAGDLVGQLGVLHGELAVLPACGRAHPQVAAVEVDDLLGEHRGGRAQLAAVVGDLLPAGEVASGEPAGPAGAHVRAPSTRPPP